jgi:hypothetical protein
MSDSYFAQPVDEMVHDQEQWWNGPYVNQSIKWCMENREAILALHFSGVKTKAFNRYASTWYSSNKSANESQDVPMLQAVVQVLYVLQQGTQGGRADKLPSANLHLAFLKQVLITFY